MPVNITTPMSQAASIGGAFPIGSDAYSLIKTTGHLEMATGSRVIDKSDHLQVKPHGHRSCGDI